MFPYQSASACYVLNGIVKMDVDGASRALARILDADGSLLSLVRYYAATGVLFHALGYWKNLFILKKSNLLTIAL